MIADPNAKNKTYPAQLGIFLSSTGGGLIISVFLSLLIWLMMEGTSFPHKTSDMLQARYYNVNMVLQAISTLFIFFVPTYIYAMICYRRPTQFLGFNLNFTYKQVLLVVLLLLITFPLAGSLGELNRIFPIPKDMALRFKAWEDARQAEEMALININTLPRYILSMFIIAFLPALFEETFFRAGMQNLLVRWFKGPWIAIIVTSIIFSLVHISYYGFLVRFALGVILGLIFYYSGSIWLSVLFHFLFNGLQVTMLYVSSNSTLAAHKDIETNFPVWLGIPALIFLYYIFDRFRKLSLPQLTAMTNEAPEDDLYAWTKNQPE